MNGVVHQIAPQDILPVIIVGGGVAGLCCARELQASGQAFQLFEAADGLGGRVRTDVVDGFVLDRGFQVLQEAYPEARRVLDYEALDLQRFKSGALIHNGQGFHLLGDPLRHPGDAWASLTTPDASLTDLWRLFRLRQRLAGKSLEELFAGKDQSTLQALRAEGFSEHIIDRFFKPFLGGVFLDESLETSARMFHFVFHMFNAGHVALPRKGMGAIPAQLAAGLPRDALHLSSPVERVSSREVVLGDGSVVSGRAVVVAADRSGAEALLPNLVHRSGSRTICMYFDAPSPPLRKPLLVLNGSGTGGINTLHVVSEVNSAAAPAGRSLISVSLLHAASEAEVRCELSGWFGEGVSDWRMLRCYDIPQALPSQPPGILEPMARPVQREDGVFICGDHMDQASLQGAMVSGRRAAEAVLSGRHPLRA